MKKKSNKAKKSDRLYRYNLLIDTIERYENFKYVPRELSIDWCCDSIAWLWKWRKITAEEKDSLCERMISIMNMESYKYR